METILELDTLMKEIDDQISNAENISEKKGYLYIKFYDHLKDIKSKLENNKYKFVFIGQKGIGKTTTILELFGLNKKIDKKNEDLLTTASGGTTTCEVEILESHKEYTYFEIEPVDSKILNQYIDDFCATHNDSDTKKIDENQYLPSEITRSIRNMIGLKPKDIKELYEDCKSIEKFEEEIIRRINIENRNETIIKCEKKNGTNFKDCHDKFNLINLCKIPNVLLPQKIKLYVTSDIFEFSKHSYIDSIIDTRGIDTVDSSKSDANKMKREDILNYIDNEQENCVFIFIDNIKPAPSQGISELLKSRITTGNQFRFYVIININGQEAEDVMTDDGKAKTVQVGIDYKKDDILGKFKQLNISFLDNNLLFYNSRLNRPCREDILKQIETNLVEKRADSFKKATEIYNAFEKSKFDFEDNLYAMKNFDSLYKLIEDTSASKEVFDRFLEIFLDELRKTHPVRIHAINRYRGEHYAFDFYHEISLIVENLFDEYFMDSKDKIINKVNEFKSYKNISELELIKYRIFIEKFEKDYIDYRNALKDYIKDDVKNSFHDSAWKNAVAKYGMGSGYRDRVLDIYKNELTSVKSLNNLKDSCDSKWNKLLIENSLDAI